VTESEALKLWEDLRAGFVNQERLLVQIINERAWEPLGYASFVEAWNDRMQGVRLATAALKAHVVYALLDDGMEPSEAYQHLAGSGIGPRVVESLAEKKALGIPPGRASVVRSHYRSKPTERRFIHVELSPSEIAHFNALAEQSGRDMADEAAKAVRAHFRSLERRVTSAA